MPHHPVFHISIIIFPPLLVYPRYILRPAARGVVAASALPGGNLLGGAVRFGAAVAAGVVVVVVGGGGGGGHAAAHRVQCGGLWV